MLSSPALNPEANFGYVLALVLKYLTGAAGKTDLSWHPHDLSPQPLGFLPTPAKVPAGSHDEPNRVPCLPEVFFLLYFQIIPWLHWSLYLPFILKFGLQGVERSHSGPLVKY